MKREHLKAAAEAFANITPIESACYHYLHNGFSDVYKQQLAQHYHQQYQKTINPKYLDAVVITALTELTYPIAKETDVYAWSDRQRAAFSGISKSTWSRNGLSETTNFIIDDIRSTARKVYAEVVHQIGGWFEVT